MIDIDIDDLVGKGLDERAAERAATEDRPTKGAEDLADGERPAKARDGDDPADTDGDGEDRERTAWNRERNRLKRANGRMSREMAMLREELDEVRGYVKGLARVEVDRASGSLAAAVEAAEHELRKAHDDGDSEGFIKALRKRDEARDRLNGFRTQSGTDEPEPSPRARQSAAEPGIPDEPALKRWMAKNEWFDWSGGDEDSQMVSEISRKLMAEKGYKLSDDRLYAEIDRRMRAYNPDLYADDDQGDVDLPRTAGGSNRTLRGGEGSGRKLPAASRDEIRLAEAAGIDLSNAKTKARWEANRRERFEKTGRL